MTLEMEESKKANINNAIIELLKNNKKIAVTANSHKVIHNLLERVENLANKQKFVFKVQDLLDWQ